MFLFRGISPAYKFALQTGHQPLYFGVETHKAPIWLRYLLNKILLHLFKPTSFSGMAPNPNPNPNPHPHPNPNPNPHPHPQQIQTQIPTQTQTHTQNTEHQTPNTKHQTPKTITIKYTNTNTKTNKN